MNIRDAYNASAIALVNNEVASNKIAYLGSGLFPAKKKMGLDLKWIKTSKGLPVSLAPSNFDAVSTLRSREGFKITETEMAFFRESMLIKEADEQEIMRAQDSTDPYARDVLNRIFDDANTLIDGANVVPERMIMQLLAPSDGSPKISIAANGATYAYNYDPSGTYKENNIALNGTITGTTWAGTRNIIFTFENEENTSENDGDNGSETDEIPTVGSIYKGCYVLKSETTGNSTVVTLMTGKEYRDGFTGLASDMTAFRSAVDNAIAGISVEEITGWRLPSLDEIEMVKNNFLAINSALISNDLTNLTNNNILYLYLDNQDDIKSFSLANGYSFDAKESSFLRAFAQKTFNN